MPVSVDDLAGSTTGIQYMVPLRRKRFLATVQFFLGAAGDGAAPTVACSGAQTPAAPRNGTAGAAGDTSRPYKWGLICRGGSITSRPWKWYL